MVDYGPLIAAAKKYGSARHAWMPLRRPAPKGTCFSKNLFRVSKIPFFGRITPSWLRRRIDHTVCFCTLPIFRSFDLAKKQLYSEILRARRQGGLKNGFDYITPDMDHEYMKAVISQEIGCNDDLICAYISNCVGEIRGFEGY